MLIDNIISLTYASLQSEPSVSECYDIVFQSADVKRGDLFVVQDAMEIKTALHNGAYALLYDAPLNVCDDEIAWIKVDNVEHAVKKILRHQLLQHAAPVIALPRVCLDVIQTLSADERLVVINNASLEAMYKAIQKVTSASILVIDEALVSTGVFPTCISHSTADTSDCKVVESSLFQSSFVFNGIYYDQLRISELILPYLQEALSFFQHYNLSYNIFKTASIPHFEPVFLNKSLKIKEYGTSERVVILENDTVLFEQAVSFLHQRASWSTIVIFVPKHINIKKYENVKYHIFETANNLMQSLRPLEFNFALIYYDKSLKEYFNEERQPQQLTFAL